ncbi:LytTR family DNA-binding domain-containing protein [Olivibacter sp. 47]|uniref:LytTR family DNA-binding domain-containing protein n=1 Tax=Olivibacter sp. 47 TaxID=3056486 RepID=UPI0033901ADA
MHQRHRICLLGWRHCTCLYPKRRNVPDPRSVDELESILDPSLFFRANRQFIINRAAVQMAEHFFNRRLIVKLSVETPERIVVSKVKASDLLAWLAS